MLNYNQNKGVYRCKKTKNKMAKRMLLKMEQARKKRKENEHNF
jgi:hypothetical protein